MILRCILSSLTTLTESLSILFYILTAWLEFTRGRWRVVASCLPCLLKWADVPEILGIWQMKRPLYLVGRGRARGDVNER